MRKKLLSCGLAAVVLSMSVIPASIVSAEETVTLKYTYWGSTNVEEATNQIIANFEEAHPGVKVEALCIPDDNYETKLTTMIAGGEAPDIAWLKPETIAFTLGEQGQLLNMLDVLNNDPTFDQDQLMPNMIYYWEPGKAVGVGTSPQMYLMYYNVDMFKEAGIEEPPTTVEDAWTWDEFVEVAQKMTLDINGNNATEEDFDPENIAQYGFRMDLWWGNFGNFIYSNGGDWVSDDGTSFALTEPEAVEAIQKITDLIHVYHVMPDPVESKSLPGTAQALQSRKVAMCVDGQWANIDLGNAEGLTYNCAALPVFDEYVTMGGTAMAAILKDSENPDLAWEFIKYMTNPELALELYESANFMPIWKEWYTDEVLYSKWAQNNPYHPAGYKGAVLDAMTTNSIIGPQATVVNFNKIMEIVDPALYNVWMGDQSVEEALASVEDQVAPLIVGKREMK